MSKYKHYCYLKDNLIDLSNHVRTQELKTIGIEVGDTLYIARAQVVDGGISIIFPDEDSGLVETEKMYNAQNQLPYATRDELQSVLAKISDLSERIAMLEESNTSKSNPFKVGDRVRVYGYAITVLRAYNCFYGEVCEISSVVKGDAMVVMADSRVEYAVHYKQCELIKERGEQEKIIKNSNPFRVGDRVRVYGKQPGDSAYSIINYDGERPDEVKEVAGDLVGILNKDFKVIHYFHYKQCELAED